ncbi:MAG: hypothetical protein GC182_12045 [Rhodopseudomonas sp.]|nr:hypothetical protein [Rhodopseudomonas sp.]
MKTDHERDEDAAIHRTRCAIAEATAGLQRLGLHQMVADGGDRFRPVDLDPAQRRELLMFLSELEELVKGLGAMSAALASDIDRTNTNMNAQAAYRRVGMVLRQQQRQARH